MVGSEVVAFWSWAHRVRFSSSDGLISSHSVVWRASAIFSRKQRSKTQRQLSMDKTVVLIIVTALGFELAAAQRESVFLYIDIRV